MKLEKIAQLLDITLNNNMSSSKNMMSNSVSGSDILSYNLVAGNFFEKNSFVRLLRNIYFSFFLNVFKRNNS
jgi:hypothetical protein